MLVGDADMPAKW